MRRMAIILCVSLCGGCSTESNPDAAERGSATEVEEGGIVENADRDKAEAFFLALGNVQSAAEEEKLLTEFAAWLKKSGYRIRVVENNGKHSLSCPYFPPVTPWIEHSFLDIKNLELLPRLEDGG